MEDVECENNPSFAFNLREKRIQVSKVVEYFDKYGFAVFKTQFSADFLDERCHNYQKSSSTHKKNWENIIKKWIYYYHNGSGTKVYSLITKGVPRSIRPILWKKLLNMEALKTNSEFRYKDGVTQLRREMIAFGITEYNISRAEQDLVRMDVEEADDVISSCPRFEANKPTYIQTLRQILLDVARTFTTHKMYFGETSDAIEGRAALFRILAVYNTYNPEVGYCQGMSFIAGMLLMILTEEDSFWCFVALLSRPKYLQKYFDHSLARVKCHASVFDSLLQKRQPRVWQHLTDNGLNPLIYITQWFMCLFTSLPCWDSVLSIWDLLLFEGVTAIFRTALAVVQSNSGNLLSAEDANGLIPLLQRLPPSRTHSEVLLPILWNTVVDKWELDTIQDILNEGANKLPQLLQNPPKTAKENKSSKATLTSKMKSGGKAPYGKILNRIVSMFAANKSGPSQGAQSSKTIPDIVVTTSPHHAISGSVNADEQNMSPIKKVMSPEKTAKSTLNPLHSLQPKMVRSPEWHRVRAQSTSAVSLGKVSGVAVSSATDHQAFCEFNARAPLRRSQRSKSCLVRQNYSNSRPSLSGSPVELKSLLNIKENFASSADMSVASPLLMTSFQVASPSQTSFDISVDETWISPTYSDEATFSSPVETAFAF